MDNAYNVVEVLTGIENVFVEEAKKGQTVAPIDAIISLIQSVKNEVIQNPQYAVNPSLLTAQWAIDKDKSIAEYNATRASELEMFKSVIVYGQMALKSALLINGGAAVATLAFISNVWGKVSDPIALYYLVKSLSMFASGVLAAAIAVGLTYATQCGYSYSMRTATYLRASYIIHGLTITVGVLAYCFFAAGMYQANEALVINLLKK